MPSLFVSLSVAALLASQSLAVPHKAEPRENSLKSLLRRATGYSIDLFQGANLQETTSQQPSVDLEFTTGGGVPVWSPLAAERLGNSGPLLLQDVNMVENLAHFNRERIQERVVHAKGAGAHGYFEVTTTTGAQYSVADFLQTVGQRTSLTARFSTTSGESGSADTRRDLRGMSWKLRTNEGILDWVFLNVPIFWVRDPNKFPAFTHSQKRNPQTHLQDHVNYWDYLSQNPESINLIQHVFTDLGTPYGIRYMDSHSGHTFRLVKSTTEWYYVKFRLISDQGIQNMTLAQANEIAGTNPDFAIQDLEDAIDAGDYPSWTVYIQVLTPQQAQNFTYNIFDITKEWTTDLVPTQEIGKIVLTQNPNNYHAEVEQLAFSPGQLVPGIEPTEDPVLQSRIFAYPDAERYRLGVNHQQLEVNAPINPVANYQRDGLMVQADSQGSRPDIDSSIDPLQIASAPYDDTNHTIWVGGTVRYLSTIQAIDFVQPNQYWNSLSATDQDHFISNLAAHFGLCNDTTIQKKQLNIFAQVNTTMANLIAAAVNITSY